MLREIFSCRRVSALFCAAALALPLPALAGGGENYTISADDGYGIAECMHTGSACGRVIADSWCESHGHAHVIAYGLGSDVTGSTADSGLPMKVAASDVVIRCGD